MNCFSMIRKMISDKFFNHEPILPLHKAPEPSVEAKVHKTETKPQVKNLKKKPSDEEDDLFKEMEPQYVAARRIGATTLVSKKPKSSSRFDMEVHSGGSWEVEDFN